MIELVLLEELVLSGFLLLILIFSVWRSHIEDVSVIFHQVLYVLERLAVCGIEYVLVNFDSHVFVTELDCLKSLQDLIFSNEICILVFHCLILKILVFLISNSI